MKRLVDRFGEQSAICPDIKALGRLLEDATWELGFHFFALLHHASMSSPRNSYVRLDNYPADWVSELESRGLVRHDPVHFASRRTSAGFAWGEIDAIARLDPRQRAVLQESRRFGLGDGFTVPANVPGEPSGSCSFAVRHGAELPRSRLMCAELVGVHAFRAARRLNGDLAPSGRPHLSRREIECLRLIALGKTDWEVAAILGISVETARQYVKRARRAYDVVSRTQLVVLGLRDAWLGFEDAIPPDG
jgi:LuxR family quorum-sensing system transcriptional regulator CciR